MTSFFDAFDPTVKDANRSTVTTLVDGPGGQRARARFSGALDQARQQLQSDRDRQRDRDHRDDGAVVAMAHQDVERIEVTRARDRLRRSGHTEATGVPRDTIDTPREAIDVRASDRAKADARSSGAPRQRVRRGGTKPLGIPAPPRRAQTPAPKIPLPPLTGVPRPQRQTLSYAFRSPASGRDEITMVSRDDDITTPKVASDAEVTQVFSRQALDAATRIPPVPAWAGARTAAGAPAQAVDPPQGSSAQAPEAAAKPTPSVEPSGAQAIVSGPLRAYAAAMPSAPVLDSIFGAASAAANAAAEAAMGLATALADTSAAASTRTIGEPISVGLDLDPAALQQLGGAGVPPQSLPNPRGVSSGRPAMDLASELSAKEAPQIKTTVGRGGLQRAEVVVGAGDARVGLAITTVGPHVSVEAQVPSEMMADAMRTQLDDLKAALERHDLELSDLSFGEAGDSHRRGDSQSGSSASDEVAGASDEESAANVNAPPGVRIVA